MEVLKVGTNSKPKAVAGALSAVIEKNGAVEMHSVGAGAVNQAVKSIAIARGFMAPKGIDLISVIAFTTVEINGQEKTAIKFIVKPSK
ncbi:MAG: stage V sporulation protein S [Candidatus Muiribacteriota bacterium]|jgi:stage V sporulation protein S